MWYADWLLSVPLLVLTTLVHAYGLLLIHEIMMNFAELRVGTHRRFVMATGASMILITMLHGLEASFWALVYQWIGALPGQRQAMLYSLGAMTTFGHADLHLEPRWQMMGVIESLNGVVLFGLTTATLFSVMAAIPLQRGQR